MRSITRVLGCTTGEVGYRDDNEALRQRLTQLENELTEAKAKLTPHRPLLPSTNPFLGGPTRLAFEGEVQGELDEQGMERLVSHLRRELGELGRIDRLGRTLAWSTTHRNQTRAVEMVCEVQDQRTIIRMQESFTQLAGGLFGGVVGGVGGGGLGVVLPLTILFGSPVMVAVATVGWVAAVYGLVRRGYRRLTIRRGEQLRVLMNNLLDTAMHEARGTPPDIRVETEEVLEEDAPPPALTKLEAD